MKQHLSIICLILTACGGGGSDSISQPTPTTIPQTNPTCTPDPFPIQIHTYGDSTMAGIVVTSVSPLEYYTTTKNPSAALQVLMNARFGIGTVSIIPHGIGGGTVAGLLATNEKIQSISVENYGINDSSRFSVEEFKNNLRLLAPDIYQTPVPTDPNQWYGRPVKYLEYVQAVRDVAAEKGKPVIDMYKYVESIPNWQGLLSDGVHPGEVLYTMMGEYMFKEMEPMVAKRSCK